MKVELEEGDWRELDELRVVDLRLLLGKYDLSKSGTKPILLKRLENYLQELRESEKAEEEAAAAASAATVPGVRGEESPPVEEKEEELRVPSSEEEKKKKEGEEEEEEVPQEREEEEDEAPSECPGPIDPVSASEKRSPSVTRVESLSNDDLNRDGEESPLMLDADVSYFKEEGETEDHKDLEEEQQKEEERRGKKKEGDKDDRKMKEKRQGEKCTSPRQGTRETVDTNKESKPSPEVEAALKNSTIEKKEEKQKQEEEENTSPLNGSADHENTSKKSMPTPLAKPIIPFRKLTRSVSKDERKPRTWSDCKLPDESAEAVSTESIKDIIPNLKPLLETNTSVLDEELVDHDTSGIMMDEEEETTTTTTTQTAPSTENKRENNESKENYDAVPPSQGDVSPSKRPRIDPPPPVIDENETDVLLIRNLVRPFTLTQLKELLKRTGNVQDFWINKIKSHCYVRFSKVEEASETRHALDGVKWPSSNPKTLSVTFSTRKKMEETAEENTSFEAPPIKTEQKEAVRPSKEKEKTTTESKESTKPQLLDDLFRKTKTTPCIYWTVNEKSLRKEDRKKDEVLT